MTNENKRFYKKDIEPPCSELVDRQFDVKGKLGCQFINLAFDAGENLTQKQLELLCPEEQRCKTALYQLKIIAGEVDPKPKNKRTFMRSRRTSVPFSFFG